MSKVLKTVGRVTMSIRTNLQAIHGADEMDSVGELVICSWNFSFRWMCC